MKPRVYNPTLNSSISSKGRNRQWKTCSWFPFPPPPSNDEDISACSTCFCAQMCVDYRFQLCAFLAAPFWFLDPKVPENSWYIRMDSQKWLQITVKTAFYKTNKTSDNVAELFRLEICNPWFKSSTLPSLDLFSRTPEFNSSTALCK